MHLKLQTEGAACNMEIPQITHQLIEQRKKTIALLQKLADELDKHEQNGRIAHVTGLSASIVSGVITAGCLIAIPFTGGLSAIGAGVAAGVGLAGGSVSLGTLAVKKLLKKGILKEVKEAIDEDRKLQESLKESIREFMMQPDTYLKGAHKLVGIARVIAEIADVADDALKGLGAAAKVSKVLGVVGGIISVAILPWDIVDLVKTSIDIHKKTITETAANIRDIAVEMEKTLPELSEAHRRFAVDD